MAYKGRPVTLQQFTDSIKGEIRHISVPVTDRTIENLLDASLLLVFHRLCPHLEHLL